MAIVHKTDLAKYCKTQNAAHPFLWQECSNIVSSGQHNDRHPQANRSLIDGIYFSAVNTDEDPVVPTLQSEFVPLIAEDLGIDLSRQKVMGSCPVNP